MTLAWIVAMSSIRENEAAPQARDPRDDERPHVRGAPRYLPPFAALLVVLMMLIEADVA